MTGQIRTRTQPEILGADSDEDTETQNTARIVSVTSCLFHVAH